MKKIFLLFTISMLSFTLQAQEIKWMTFNEATEAQKKNPKPIFMDAFTEWCTPCKMLDKMTFTDSKVVEHINKNYYAVKFNAEGNEEINHKGNKYTNPGFDPERKNKNATHDFTMFLRIPGYPSMVIFDSKGEVTKTIVGYQTPEKLLNQI
ncbi:MULTISPECIES: thioredoxin family protein [Myroides]|uniref:Thioredoxin fold domain-containing protein n=1 Tax=Myroides albus TaxID=2562892 RepID=A0A6I3LBY0_9FLAO|nr:MULTISPECIES: thioredoxin fold domain-containing protein [Myroides]MTG96969.1 thioredoxin fold domain-containing protein [Myroides albus]MVX35338.1 thioredoxin fold domain-containing protein [Myroides sp. LoEW2-1]UVD78279.1 thioredoxin fold domain-containing protein [Myroides albus]